MANPFLEQNKRQDRVENNSTAFDKWTTPSPEEALGVGWKEGRQNPYLQQNKRNELEELREKYDTDADMLREIMGTREFNQVQATETLKEKGVISDETDEVKFNPSYKEGEPGLNIVADEGGGFIREEELDVPLRRAYEDSLKKEIAVQGGVTEDITEIQSDMHIGSQMIPEAKPLDEHAGPGRKFKKVAEKGMKDAGRRLLSFGLNGVKAFDNLLYAWGDPERERNILSFLGKSFMPFTPEKVTPQSPIDQYRKQGIRERDDIVNKLMEDMDFTRGEAESVYRKHEKLYEVGMVGKSLKSMEDKLLEWTKTDWTKEAAREFGARSIDAIDEEQRKMWEPILDENPGINSFREWSNLIGDGLISFGTAMGVSYSTGSSTAGAAFLSSVESLPTYKEAREAEQSPQEAMDITAKKGVGTFLLEKMGLDFIMNYVAGSSPGLIGAMVKSSLSEGAEETSQEFWQNLVDKEWTEDTKLTDGLVQAGVAALLPGAIGGAISSQVGPLEQDSFMQKAMKKVSRETIQEANNNNVSVESQARRGVLKDIVLDKNSDLTDQQAETIAKDLDNAFTQTRDDFHREFGKIPVIEEARQSPSELAENIRVEWGQNIRMQGDSWLETVIAQRDTQQLDTELVQTYQAMERGDIDFKVGEGRLLNMVRNAENEVEAQQALETGKEAGLIGEDYTLDQAQEQLQQYSQEAEIVDNLISRVENIDTSEMGEAHTTQIEALKRDVGIDHNPDAISDDKISLEEFADINDIGINKATLNNLQNTNVNTMSAKQLADLNRVMHQLEHHYKNAGKVSHITDEPVRVEQAREEIMRNVEMDESDSRLESLGSNLFTKALARAYDGFTGTAKSFWNQCTRPHRLFSRLFQNQKDYGKAYDYFYFPANDASKEQIKLYRAMDKDVKGVFDENNIDKDAFFNETEKIRGRELTPVEKVGTVLSSQDPVARASQKIKDNITDEELQAIKDSLTEEQQEVADFLRNSFDHSYRLSNQTHLETEGTYFGYQEGYWPMNKSYNPSDHAENVRLDQRARIKAKDQLYVEEGHVKARNPDALPDVNYNAIQVYYQTAKSVSNYAAWKPVVKDWNKIWNDDMESQIEEQFGESAVAAINHWKRTSVHGYDPTNQPNWAQKQLKSVEPNVARSFISYRLPSILRQPLSNLLIMAESPQHTQYLKDAYKELINNPRETAESVFEKAPQLEERFVYYDVRRKSESRGVQAKLEGRKDRGTKWIQEADQKTVIAGWLAAYNMAKDGNVEGYTDSEQDFIHYADLELAKTQPSSREVNRPAIFGQQGMISWFVKFQNAASQWPDYFAHDIIGKLSKGEISASNAAWKFIMTDVLSGLLLGMTKRGRLPDDAKEVALDLATPLTTGVPALGNLAYGAMLGFTDLTPVGLTPFQRVMEAAVDIGKGDIPDAFDSLVEVARLTGLPVSAVKTATEGAWDMANGDAPLDPRRLFWSEWQMSSDQETEQIRNLIDQGELKSPSIDIGE